MPFPNQSTQFKPGNPGGPGRPRKRPITDRLIEQLQATEYVGWELLPGETVADMVAACWIRLIIDDGDTQALRELLSRLEGRVPHRIEADVSVEDDAADLEAILTALGFTHKQSPDQAAAGQKKPRGTGGRRKQGEVEASAPPQVAGRRTGSGGKGDRKAGKPAAHHHHAAKARKK